MFGVWFLTASQAAQTQKVSHRLSAARLVVLSPNYMLEYPEEHFIKLNAHPKINDFVSLGVEAK